MLPMVSYVYKEYWVYKYFFLGLAGMKRVFSYITNNLNFELDVPGAHDL